MSDDPLEVLNHVRRSHSFETGWCDRMVVLNIAAKSYGTPEEVVERAKIYMDYIFGPKEP